MATGDAVRDGERRVVRRGLLAIALLGVVVFAAGRIWTAGKLPLFVDESLWQLADSAFLAGKPFWPVVLSFHAQPPGLVILQWLDVNAVTGLLGLSLRLATLIYIGGAGIIVLRVTRSGIAAALAVAFIGCHPSTWLYGTWFFSSIYLAAALTLAVIALLAWVGSGRGWALGGMLLALAVASLFHAGYWAAYLVAAAAVILFALRTAPQALLRPATIGLLAASLAVAMFAPAKNEVLFGFLSPSSWSRLNLSLLYTRGGRWDECKAAIRNAPASDDGAAYVENAWGKGWVDRELLFKRAKTNGAINMNHFEVLRCARDLNLFKEIDPVWALKRLALAGYELAALPSWDYPAHPAGHLYPLAPVIAAYELFLPRGQAPEYGYLKGGWRSKAERLRRALSLPTALFTVLLGAAFLGHLRIIARRLRAQGPASARSDRAELAVAFAWLLLIALVAVFVFGNGQEMNRVRFSLTPLFLLIVADAFRRLLDGRGRPPVTRRPAASG